MRFKACALGSGRVGGEPRGQLPWIEIGPGEMKVPVGAASGRDATPR